MFSPPPNPAFSPFSPALTPCFPSQPLPLAERAHNLPTAHRVSTLFQEKCSSIGNADPTSWLGRRAGRVFFTYARTGEELKDYGIIPAISNGVENRRPNVSRIEIAEVPNGHPKIAQRFNVGTRARETTGPVPEGRPSGASKRVSGQSSTVPSGRAPS